MSCSFPWLAQCMRFLAFTALFCAPQAVHDIGELGIIPLQIWVRPQARRRRNLQTSKLAVDSRSCQGVAFPGEIRQPKSFKAWSSVEQLAGVPIAIGCACRGCTPLREVRDGQA